MFLAGSLNRFLTVLIGSNFGLERPSQRAIRGRDVPCSKMEVSTMKNTRLKITQIEEVRL